MKTRQTPEQKQFDRLAIVEINRLEFDILSISNGRISLSLETGGIRNNRYNEMLISTDIGTFYLSRQDMEAISDFIQEVLESKL